MKLLLTSAGIVNESISNSLQSLSNKKPSEMKVCFIPTAMNGEKGNKDWYIKQLTDLQKCGYSWIDIVEISATGLDWKSRLEEADVIYVGGGNTFYLLDQVRKTGFDVWILENKERILYVGSSAGSILVTPSIGIAGVEPGDENNVGISDLTGLNLVHFEISPHTPSMIPHEANVGYSQSISNEFYELDDETAIQIIDDKVEIISEGKWQKIK